MGDSPTPGPATSGRRSVRRHRGTGKVRYRVADRGTRLNSVPSPHAVSSAPRWEVVCSDAETARDAGNLALAVDELVHRMSRLHPARIWRIRVRRFDNGKLRVRLEAASPGPTPSPPTAACPRRS